MTAAGLKTGEIMGYSDVQSLELEDARDHALALENEIDSLVNELITARRWGCLWKAEATLLWRARNDVGQPYAASIVASRQSRRVRGALIR